MNERTLTELFHSEKILLTAHRGASFELPENTLPALEKAVEWGADIIEFDLRSTADGIPVLLHDETIDRTSDGAGRPEQYRLEELRQFNFSGFIHNRRQEEPLRPGLPIPTFEEVIRQFRGRAGMNIQLYLASETALREVCRLYREYELYDQGFFAIGSLAEAELVRSWDPDIEICLLPGWQERSEPETLRLCRDFGCRFVQPVAQYSTAATFRLCRELNLRENVFFADSLEDADHLLQAGARGLMTNRIRSLGDELTGQNGRRETSI